MRHHRAAALLAMTLCGAIAAGVDHAQANIMASTLYSGGSHQGLIAPVAESFVADQTGMVSEVQFEVSTSARSGSLVVTLMSDHAGPSTLLATLGRISLTTLGAATAGAETLVSLSGLQTIPGAFGLTPGQVYWLEFSANASTGIYLTNNGTLVGPSQYWRNGTEATLPLMQFCVSSDSACGALGQVFATGAAAGASVGEPGTIALLGAGMTGLGLARRRRSANQNV